MAKIKKVPDESGKSKLQKIRDKINEDYGKGTIMGAAEKPQYMDIISTGSVLLDVALGVGGLPKGRIVEIYGPESSGKTTLAMHVIAEAQKKGGMCAIVDAEHAMDMKYAKDLGIDLSKLDISQPDYGEQALNIAMELVESAEYDVVVIDSVAALTPKSEIEGEVGDSTIGKQARMMSQALRKLVAIVDNSKTLVIFINQLREKIGVIFGSPEVTTGGNALKFYASVRLDIRKKMSNKDSEETFVSNTVKVKVIKNKVAPPFKTCEFDIVFGVGINKTKEVVNIAIDTEIIAKSGSWYSYEGNKVGQGLENVISIMNDNPDLYEEIKTKVMSNLHKIELDVEPEAIIEERSTIKKTLTGTEEFNNDVNRIYDEVAKEEVKPLTINEAEAILKTANIDDSEGEY